MEDVFLATNGVKLEDEAKEAAITCRCKLVNPPKSRYCVRCGSPLSVGIALHDEELKKTEINKTIEFMMEMMEKPELMEKFQEFKEEMS